MNSARSSSRARLIPACPSLVRTSTVLLCLCAVSVVTSAQPQKLVEVYRVGSKAAGDPVLFSSILDIAVDSEGRIFVVDRQLEGVHVFGPDGWFLRVLGSKRDGLSGFKRLTGVAVGPHDTLYAWDGYLKRVSVFAPVTNELIHTVPIESIEGRQQNPMHLLGVTEKGIVFRYASPSGVVPGGIQSMGTKQSPEPVVLVAFSGKPSENPLFETVSEKMNTFSMRSGRNFTTSQPYVEQWFAGVSASGMTYAALSDKVDVEFKAEDGRVLHKVSWQHTPIPVTRADREAHLERYSTDETRQAVKAAGWPEVRPAFTDLLVDSEDQLWVRLSANHDAPRVKYVVLRIDDGQVVGEIAVPSSVEIIEIRDGRAYASAESDSGDPLLVVYNVHD